MWRILIDSVAGTSHESGAVPCQDYSLHTVLRARDQQIMLIACADGAGSARLAGTGSRMACETAIRVMADRLQASGEPTDVCIRHVCEQVHLDLKRAADAAENVLRDYACTLLLAIVGADESSFLQIGDGAIVVETPGTFSPVFWPKTGEYHNTTFFVTDDDYQEHVQSARFVERIDGFAVLTDGLQMLALDFATESAHAGFFVPFFTELRRVGCPDDLRIAFRSFLNSESVNARTDDDKTFVVAVRDTFENLPR